MQKGQIDISHIGKQYQLGESMSHDTMRDAIMSSVGRMLGREKVVKEEKAEDANYGTIWALRDISFSINPGDVIGIIGRNGSGKSTLLKILSRITEPTEGEARLAGRVAALLEVGTGFHPELTGRENIFMNGAILGMKRSEIRDRFNDIVEFSGVGRFIDTPVKRYSSGMYVRLAFAVTAHLEPDILLVDEVLAVGDSEFQERCLGRMKEVCNEGRTVIFVSHQMSMVTKLCTRGVLLDRGKMLQVGDIHEVVRTYLQGNPGAAAHGYLVVGEQKKKMWIESLTTRDATGKEEHIFGIQNEIYAHCRIQMRHEMRGVYLTFTLYDSGARKVFVADREMVSLDISKDVTTCEVVLRIPDHFLQHGTYTWSTAIHIPGHEFFDHVLHEPRFDVEDMGSGLARYGNADMGVVYPPCTWEIRV